MTVNSAKEEIQEIMDNKVKLLSAQKINGKKGYPLIVYWTDIAWIAAMGAMFVLCLEMFYRMIVNYNGKYPSDMHYYVISNATSGEKHDRLLGFLFDYLYHINENTMEANIYLAAVIVVTIILNFVIINYYLKQDDLLDTVPRYTRQAMSVLLFFIGPIWFPVIHPYYHRFSLSHYAWQSPTQQSMTMFSLLACLCFLRMYTRYEEEGVSSVWWTATAVMTFLSTFVKPSYMLDLSLAVVVMFLAELIAGGKEGIGTRFRRLFIMGCSLVPSGLYLIYLHTREFPDESDAEAGIVFGLEHILKQDHVIASIVFGIAFPVLIFAVNYKRLNTRRYMFAVALFIAGMLQWLLIAETGKRANYGNFTWGRIYATYFLTLLSTVLYAENWYNKDSVFANREKARKIYLIIAAVILLMSLISQCRYFDLVLRGARAKGFQI